MEQTIHTIQDALAFFGVTESTLTSAEKASMDEEGYVLLPDFIPPDHLQRMRDVFEELMAREGRDAGREFHQEGGTRRLANLVNKDPIFDTCYTHPKILALVQYVIGRDFKLTSINGRDALPGEGDQGLHADWGSRKADEPFHIFNSIWLLDDFTAENGATRLVPGTHRLPSAPGDVMRNPSEPHPDEIIVLAPAGTVIAYNAHLWHGGTRNRTQGAKRRVLHPAFIAREFPQQQNQRDLLLKKTYDRISPAARYLLDVE
jgi:ectoine hydroxylase-related dioxygenase (phytanoyl-CoA dioxygenase family)